MKKILSAIFCILIVSSLSAQAVKKTAQELKKESLTKGSVEDSVKWLSSAVDNAATPADRRSALYFLAQLQEQCSMFEQASLSYVNAAGITAGDAKNMPKVSSEQLVLDAVRTSLNCGNSANARSYLNSAVRLSKNEEILAYVNLYSVWCSLCEAETTADTKDSIELLKAYSIMGNMKTVRPAVLLTLWYLTSRNEYAEKLRSEFAGSPETAIVDGTVEIACVPFYLFVPRQASSGVENVVPKTEVKTQPLTEGTPSSAKSGSEKPLKRQVGYFKGQANAENLVKALKEKGFDAYISKEGGSFAVIVDENSEGTVGLKLQDAGYENYVLE